jgi:hypothetical protein
MHARFGFQLLTEHEAGVVMFGSTTIYSLRSLIYVILAFVDLLILVYI